MYKKDITIPIQYFNRYIDLVPECSIFDALEKYGPNLLEEYTPQMIDLADFAYAEGKWTIKQKLQHIIDTERVFSYRTLVLARHDDSHLPSFDQDPYALHADVSVKTVEELMYEWNILRISTRQLFKSLKTEDLLFLGNVSNQKLNALAIGFAICGHAIHHQHLLMDRYLL
jgi:hypothetical protein